jgi:RNA polymerase sigma factor (sigma-70 family)
LFIARAYRKNDTEISAHGRVNAHGFTEAQVNPSAGMRRDERLAQLVAGGSEPAFVALYESYYDQLYRYCRSIVRDDSDAQDAVQSTLTGAFAALRRGRRDAPLRPWLFRIAHNESVSVLRRRRPEEQLSELLPDRTGSTEDRVEQRERLALLMADLHALPERQRGALVMRELNDLSHEQIAIALRTSVGAAKQAIFEARRALLEFAEGRTMACEDIQRTISDADGRALRRRRVRAHLRDCPACAAFAAAIPARRAALQAAAAPLPATAAYNLLARALEGVTKEAATGAGSVIKSGAGKTAGAMLASKALAGVVIVTSAAVGTKATATVPRFPHPSMRMAPGTVIRAIDGAPSMNAAFTVPRVQDVPGDPGDPGDPQAGGGAAASPHADWAGQASPAGNSVPGDAGAAPTGHGAAGPPAGMGPAAPRHPHPGRSSTAPGRGVWRGAGRAVSHGGGRPEAPGRSVSHGAPHPSGAPATSGGARSPRPAPSAPPGRGASQGAAKSPGPPVDPAGGASTKPDHGASQGAEQSDTPPAAPVHPHRPSPA